MADLSITGSTRRANDCSTAGGKRLLAHIFGFALLLGMAIQPLEASTDVDELLARAEAPSGVVFEIVEADEGALEDLLPKVRDAIRKLRARFPEAGFAVVSHGREEFALQSQYRSEYAEVHDQVQSLVAADVPVHVCETHAGWYGVTAEDFPEYVNVAPTGPGQINLYRELGYELIIVD